MIKKLSEVNKVLIAGSRSVDNYFLVKDFIDSCKEDIGAIFSGGADGVDKFAERYASENHIPIAIISPDWKTHGRSAGIIRNKELVNKCDVAIIIWDGVSKGTASTIKFLEESGKHYYLKRV